MAPDDLDRLHDTLMSPLAWGHIAAFEDLWIAVRGRRQVFAGFRCAA